jgi:glycosyltransferase involved in cell wall biosynthesis
MRIAHVTATFPPNYTGTGNVCYHNARQLARRGHEVHVYTARVHGAPSREVRDHVHVHRLRPWLHYGNAPFLPDLFFHLKSFDLVHLHLPFYGGCEAVYLLRKLRRVRLVITHHQDVKLPGLLGLINRLHDRLLGTALMRCADRACFTSLDYARASQYEPMLARREISVAELSNGVDPQHFAPGPRPAALEAHYELQDKRVILFVGALDRAHYFKGVDVLLHAVQKLARPDTTLLVVGYGDLRLEYERLARRLGIHQRVHFPGFVPDAQLPGYYRLADLTVLPSTTAGEAFGLVLLESLASATPVLASNLPGVRTIVADQVDGRLAQPGDVEDLAQKMAVLLNLSAEQRATMGRAGRRKVQEAYAWPRIGERLEALYGEVVSGRPLKEPQPGPEVTL